MEKDYTKPPMGVTPKFIIDAKRIQDLKEAIIRYLNADLPINTE